MDDSVPNPERFHGMTLAEVAATLGWSDAQLAAHLAQLAQVAPVDLTPDGLERVARILTTGSPHAAYG